MAPLVSVVVLTCNEEENISKCLDSLIAQDYQKDKYEVIIVDAASKDKTQNICREYPIRLVVADKKGFSHQRNKGIEAARGEYIAFTDADCAAEKSWLRKLVEQIESTDKDVVAVGGPNLVFDDDAPFSKIVGYAQETFLGSGGSAQSYRIGKLKFVSSVPNCNAIYRKEIFAKEKYDESLIGGDDCDLNFRLRQKGYKFLYRPDIIVWHRRPKSFREFIRKTLHYGKVMGQITRKNRKVVRWYAFLVAFAILAVIFSYPVIRFFHLALYVYTFAIAFYMIALVISTVQVYQRCKSIKSFMTMVLLPIQHLLYGLAFLKGLLESRNMN